MVTYMTSPQNKLTLGATELENLIVSAKITRIENGFDTATITLPSTSYYPGTVTEGTTVLLEVKDASDVNYTALFAGTVRFVTADISQTNSLILSCRGIGAGLAEMLVGAEYGTQSTNGLDTLTEIVTDSTYGLIPNYTQKILGGSASNYSFDTTKVETIADTIPYISWPYKPVNKCLNDLIDLVTAYKAGTAGPHWIVTRSGATNYLRIKLVDGTQVGWTKYYGDSQANATLTYSTDYRKINLEKMAAEANYIAYYGAWRRPSNGDYWTEGTEALWGNPYGHVVNDTDIHMVGAQSINGHQHTSPSGPIRLTIGDSSAWDFSGFTDFNTPNLNFYLYYDLTHDTHFVISMHTSATDFYAATFTQADGTKNEFAIPPNQKWQRYSLPVGPYSNAQAQNISWTAHGSPNWNSIAYISFYVNDAELVDDGVTPMRYCFFIDGLHFGDASVCRVAALSDYTGVIVKQKLITDNIGKDDSLIASDDSGLMAKLAYSELLRLRTNSTVGTIETTNMIKDILPGQWVYVQSTDYRVTKIVQNINPASLGYSTTLEVTSDLINGRARSRYEDINKQWEAIRPEWQDRQASNLKAGNVDWRVSRLVKTYA
jgi:hypothetical protein